MFTIPPRLVRLIKRILKAFLKGLSLLLFIVLALCITLVVRLQIAPISLNSYLPYLQSHLVFYGQQIEMQDLQLFYNGKLVVSGNNVRFINVQNNKEAMRFEAAEIEIDPFGFLQKKVLAHKLTMRGLRTAITYDGESFIMAGDKIFTQGSGAMPAHIPLIRILEDMRTHDSLKALERIAVSDVLIQLNDTERNESIAASDASIMIDISHEALTYELQGKLSRSRVTGHLPLSVQMIHHWNQDTAMMRVLFEDVDPRFLQGYLDEELLSIMEGAFSGSIHTNWNDQTLFDVLHFSLKTPQIRVNLPTVFYDPIVVHDATLTGDFRHRYYGSVNIYNLTGRDNGDRAIDISGHIRNLYRQKIQPDLTLAVPEMDIHGVMRYMPDDALDETLLWMNKHIQDAAVKNFVLHYNGDPENLPHCYKSCGLTIQFDYKDFTLTPLEGLPSIYSREGTFTLKEDYIEVHSRIGTWEDQELSDTTVVINNLFTPKPSDLVINGKASGNVSSVLDALEKKFTLNKEAMPTITGQHSSVVDVTVPLIKGEDPTLDDIILNVDSTVFNTHLVHNKPFPVEVHAPKAELNITEKDFLFKTDYARINESEAAIIWRDKTAHMGDNISAELDGRLNLVEVEDILDNLHMNATGVMEGKLRFEQHPQSLYTFSLEGGLTPAEMDVIKLNWYKDKGVPLRLNASGQVSLEEKRLTVNALDIQGKEVNIKGAFDYTEGALRDLYLNLNPVILGRNNFSLKLAKGALDVEGKTLDLTGFTFRHQDNDAPKVTTLNDIAWFDERFTPDSTFNWNNSLRDSLDISIALDDVFTDGGSLHEARATITRRNSLWQNADIRVRSKQGEGAQFVFAHDDAVRPNSFNIEASNAGKLFQTLGISSQLRGGILIGNGSTNAEQTAFEGVIDIVDLNFIKAPVLVRLLSLLSLTEILSNERGISFESTHVPFFYKDNVLELVDAAMSGPSIGLRFTSAINVEHDLIYTRGRLIPIEGINKVISNIPLIGTLLTGSQEGLTVANFTIEGPLTGFGVSANPLSIVTPGLVKDILGISSTGEKLRKEVRRGLNKLVKAALQEQQAARGGVAAPIMDFDPDDDADVWSE